MSMQETLLSVLNNNIIIAGNEQKVFDAGKKSEYDKFWDSYQDNGKLTGYKYKFAYSGWTDTCFNPKYPLVCTNDGGDFIFVYNTSITDTKVSITFGTSANQTFNWCSALRRTHIIVNKDTKFNSTFFKCTSLGELYVEGVIGQNGFDVSNCPLTADSVYSVLNALEDKSGDTSGTDWLITLGSANIATVGSDCEIATSKGWRYV